MVKIVGKKPSNSWWDKLRRKIGISGPKRQTNPVDRQFFLLIAGLLLFGVVMVYNSSVVTAFQEFDDKFYFAKLQAMWALIGFVAMLVTARIPYHWWRIYAKPMLYGTIGLLILVLIPGITNPIYGARRWISIGELTLQPAELAKFVLVIYLASALSGANHSGSGIHLKLPTRITPPGWVKSGMGKINISQLLFRVALVLGLVIIEPDLGTSLVLAGTALVIYWISGAPLKQFITLIGTGLVAVLGLILSSSYRAERLKTFFDPMKDPLGTSYHIRQVLIALGSGGWLGLGLGQSRQKYAYLPEVTTDSIFAVIGEEIGFLGASVVLVVFLGLIIKGLRIANRCPDPFGKLLATGMIAWVGIQAVINFSAMVVLVPLTGVPLPFISYGGSSLVVALASMGIILNISKHSK